MVVVWLAGTACLATSLNAVLRYFVVQDKLAQELGEKERTGRTDFGSQGRVEIACTYASPLSMQESAG